MYSNIYIRIALFFDEPCYLALGSLPNEYSRFGQLRLKSNVELHVDCQARHSD